MLADKWRLLGVGLVIWATGQACFTYGTLVYHNVQTAALPSDFWFLVYGIFVLLAVCSVGEDQDSTAILIADSAQATLAIILIYVTLFMNNHFSHRTLPASQLTTLYLGENLALALTATVRLLAMPDGEDRYFHRVAFTFAWLMILVSTPLNYLDAYRRADQWQGHRGGLADPVPRCAGDGLLEGGADPGPSRRRSTVPGAR